MAWIGSLQTALTGVIVLQLLQLATALRCVSCQLNERTECANGTVAAGVPGLVVTCAPTQHLCQTTIQEQVRPDQPSTLLEVVRGCSDEPTFFCRNRTEAGLRTCGVTCRGQLCNADDRIDRMMRELLLDDDGGGLPEMVADLDGFKVEGHVDENETDEMKDNLSSEQNSGKKGGAGGLSTVKNSGFVIGVAALLGVL